VFEAVLDKKIYSANQCLIYLIWLSIGSWLTSVTGNIHLIEQLGNQSNSQKASQHRQDLHIRKESPQYL
jgi:hypothetical protein